MPTPLLAYRCTGPEGFGPALPLGATHQRKRGFRLGATVRDALTERAAGVLGEGWPLRIFEVTVAQPDLLDADADAGILRARAFSVTREIPLTEAFGPRAADLVAFLAALPSIRWLRPTGAPPAAARIAELVAEHHQALSDYQPAAALPLLIVRDWHTARERFEHRDAYHRTISACPACIAVCSVRLQTTLEGAFRVAQAHAHVTAYLGAWDAAWAAGGRGVIAGITADPLFGIVQRDGQQPGARAMETVSTAHAAAREPARAVALRGAVLDTFARAPAVMPSGNEVFAGAVAAAQAAVARLHRPHLLDAHDADGVSMLTVREQMVTGFILSTVDVAVSLSVMAARHAGWHVAYLLQNVAQRDPWRPLLDLWRLGVWPMGEMAGAFVVYVPGAQN